MPQAGARPLERAPLLLAGEASGEFEAGACDVRLNFASNLARHSLSSRGSHRRRGSAFSKIAISAYRRFPVSLAQGCRVLWRGCLFDTRTLQVECAHVVVDREVHTAGRTHFRQRREARRNRIATVGVGALLARRPRVADRVNSRREGG